MKFSKFSNTRVQLAIALNDLFIFSRRGQRILIIITPPSNESYVYRMSVILNSVKAVSSRGDTSLPIYSIKTKLMTDKDC